MSNIQIKSIPTGLFKLDGGAMFGVVPKQLWQRLVPADEKNMCTWSMRCLLIETPTRKILVDTGIGDKQDEKFRSHFSPHGEDSLLGSLAKNNLSPKDITDVFLTHLHFDHVGGAVKKEGNRLVPTFPNATYYSNKTQWDWALAPNAKEKASFLVENFVPLLEAGQLEFIDSGDGSEWKHWVDGIEVRSCFGHTMGMMILKIPFGKRKVIFGADLMPSSAHIPMPYVMSYDIQPMETLKEKKWLLRECLAENHLLFFEHDAQIECASVKENNKGRIVLGEPEILNK